MRVNDCSKTQKKTQTPILTRKENCTIARRNTASQKGAHPGDRDGGGARHHDARVDGDLINDVVADVDVVTVEQPNVIGVVVVFVVDAIAIIVAVIVVAAIVVFVASRAACGALHAPPLRRRHRPRPLLTRCACMCACGMSEMCVCACLCDVNE
jgi:hypothetical protein